MTKEVIDYLTRDLMEQGKTLKNSQGLRPLHTDFINNDESQGYQVTFVDGIDDPHNDPVLVVAREANKIVRDRNEELKQKAKDGTLTEADKDEIIEKMAEKL